MCLKNAVEDSVDESGGVFVAEALGDFNGFVDGRLSRDVICEKNFVSTESENIAIDVGEATK